MVIKRKQKMTVVMHYAKAEMPQKIASYRWKRAHAFEQREQSTEAGITVNGSVACTCSRKVAPIGSFAGQGLVLSSVKVSNAVCAARLLTLMSL